MLVEQLLRRAVVAPSGTTPVFVRWPNYFGYSSGETQKTFLYCLGNLSELSPGALANEQIAGIHVIHMRIRD